MLTRCNLNFEQKTFGQIDQQGVEELIKKEFSDAKDAVVLVETIKQANLLFLKDLKLADAFAECLRIIVSTENAELRVESNGKEFAYRLLREQAGDEYVKRDDLLVFRVTPHIAAEVYNNGQGRMRSREYFQANNDGMYVFVAERLAGTVND